MHLPEAPAPTIALRIIGTLTIGSVMAVAPACIHSNEVGPTATSATTIKAELTGYNAISDQIRIISTIIETQTTPGDDDDTYSVTFSTHLGVHSVRIELGEDDEPATLIVEGTGGQRLVSQPGVSHTMEEEGAPPSTYSTWNFRQPFEVDGVEMYAWSFTRGYRPRGDFLSLSSGTYYAPIEVDGTAMHLVMLDGDVDGRFVSSADRWMLLDQPTLDRFNARRSPDYLYPFYEANMTPGDHPVFLSVDRAVYLSNVDDGHATLSVRQPDRAEGEYLHERITEHHRQWFNKMRYPQEPREVELTPEEGRTQAQTPIAWEYAYDLEPLLARSQREGKPLFVDFVSFGCGWCGVQDCLTFPDEEVAAYINEHFIPVRSVGHLVANFNAGERYDIKANPTMMLIRPDGTEIDRTTGYRKPSEFMLELQRLQSLWAEDAAE